MFNFSPNIKNKGLVCFTLMLGVIAMQAQSSFPATGFTLPPGKTIVITYETDVNANACPGNSLAPLNLSNQSNVSGTNFATVLTDDPDIAGSSNPTLTPFASAAIGNLVYQDNNRNGVFDSGDVGINGVVVRLFVDMNSNNMLDAGDGASLGSATTANVSGQDGIYSFNVCSGTYIFEVAASNFMMGGALYNGGSPYVSSPVGGAGDPDTDTDDNDDNGDPVSGFGVASAAFSVGTTDNNTIDFGFKTPTTVTIDDVTMNEGTGAGPSSFNFTVTRNDNSEAFSLTVNTANGTAMTADNDYTGISGGTVSFTAGGSLTQTVTVLVNHDNKVEANETFTVVLSGAPAGVVITDDTGLGTIDNDDNATVTLSGGSAQTEGSMHTFTATLDNPVQGPFSVAYTTNNGTASTADNDYTDNDGTLNFSGAAGQVLDITVNTTTDSKVELDETFTVALGAITGAPAGVSTAGSPQTGTITNDDAANVSFASSVSGLESTTPQTFTVTLSNPVDVNVTMLFNTANGSATTGDNDYTSVVNQTVTFNAGNTTAQSVNVAIVNDNKVETNENYQVMLSSLNASGRNVAFQTDISTGIILNDDQTILAFSTVNATQNEGNAGTTPFTFRATLSNPVQGGFTIGYETNDMIATVTDMDYVDNDNSLVFGGTAGEFHDIAVLVNGDFKVEADETFEVALTNLSMLTVDPSDILVTSAQQTGLILNDEMDWGDGPDSLPTILFYNGARHSTVLGFQLGTALDGDPGGQSTGGTHSNLANGDDTDAEGDDEDGVTLPGVFVTGTTATVTVNASQPGKLDAFMDFNWNRVLSDAGEKIFNNVALVAGDNVLTFNVPAGAVVGSSFIRFRFSSVGGLSSSGPASDGEVEDYRVNIVSNQFSIDDPNVPEGNAGTASLVYTVTRTTNTNASSVDYAITGGTATSGTDYVPLASGTINFTAGGALTAVITVMVNGDLIVEDNETIIITLSNPVNGGIGDGTGTGAITNDDNANLTLAGGSSQNETNAGTVTHNYTVTLSAAVQGGFTVSYTTDNGTAVAPGDYTDNDGTLTFAGTAGESKTITVLSNGDATVELDESFTENLGAIGSTSAVQAAAITKVGSPQTSTLLNDDASVISLGGNVSQAENLSPQVFTINLSNPVDVAVTVLFNTSNGTATTGDNDYTGIVNQTVTFPANTTTAQSVNVAINNDNKVENNEDYGVGIGTLNASGRNVSLGTSSRTGTIVNDDAATVTLTPAGGVSLDEGNTGTTPFVFTATLNNPVQGGFSVAYTTNDGTATTANNDYADNDGSLSFAGTANENQTITVLVNGDFIVEADENFTVALGAITGAPAGVTTAGSPKTGTIQNDELDYGDAPDPTYPTLAASNGAVHKAQLGVHLGAAIDGDPNGQPTGTANGDDTDAEGDDEDGVTLPSALVLNTTANITVNASTGGLLNAWVDFNQNGTWESPSEQIFTNMALVAGNNALSFAVPAGGATGTSYARFRFGNGNLTPTGLDNTGEVEDYQVQVVNTQFSIGDPVVTEGNAGTVNLGFVVSRTVNANACSVDYAITGGTATTADGDYQPLASGTLNFTAGGALTQTVNVIVNGDVKVELNETVDMTLSNPVNGSILDGSGTGTITNDDAATITIANVTVTEGDAGSVNATFNITMSNPSDANVLLNYATVDGTATIANNDYQNTTGSLTFTPGQTTKQVMVPVNGDCSIEANETFLARLSALVNNGRNVSLSGGGATLDGTGTINNDDALPVITCPANISRNVDPGVCTVSVTIPLPTTSSVCGSSVLEFRYRPVDAAGVPLGAFTAYAPSSSNTVVFSRGRYEIEWRVTDGSGSSSCSFFLTVVDNQPPVITCPPNQFVNANASCMGTVGTWAPATLSDNCTATGSIVVTQTPPPGTVLNGHGASRLVTLTANDGNGNTASCSFTVTLRDVTPPVALCKNVTVNLGSNGTVTVPPSAVNNGSTDNCSFVLSLMPNTFNCTNIGSNTVTLRAIDAGGNASTCTAKVTVRDQTGPNALCKNPMIFLNATGHATLTLADVDNGSNDPCGIASRTLSKTDFNCSEIGPAQVVTLFLTDVNGNSSSCLSNVTVKDAIAPDAVCENTTVELSATGFATVYSADLAFESSDNCSVWSYTPTVKVYTTANLGNNNLNITVKDYSNNSDICTSVVTVLPFSNASESGSDKKGTPDLSSTAFMVFPNPGYGEVFAGFTMENDGTYQLKMYNLEGRLMLDIRNSTLAGDQTIPLNVKGLPNGLYVVELQAEGVTHRQLLSVQE